MRPAFTHPSLKILILITIALSLLSPFFGPYLALSAKGISELYLWQFISFAFVHPAPLGITFPFLLHLALNMFLLWIFGSSLMERAKPRLFLFFYLSSVLVGGLVAYATMVVFHLPYSYAGTSVPLYSILTSWTMLNPQADLLLFFAIPFKARWLLLGLIGVNLLIDLSYGDWISFFSYAAAFFYGYLFSMIAFRCPNLFPFLRPFDQMALTFWEKIRHLHKKDAPTSNRSKVYDIKSGDPVLDDDQFMDAMLSRISLHGESSLTQEEKKRMQQISERKKKTNH